MLPIRQIIASGWIAAFLCFPSGMAWGKNVSGYSVMKGRFLNQTGPGALVLDPDFSYSFLASVDLVDFDLLQEASVRAPNGSRTELEDLGDYWAFLASQESYSDLTASYGWGDYALDFTSVDEGSFSCSLSFPNTPLPPNLRLVNFHEVQEVDASQPITLRYEFSTAPHSNDLVQIYINLGHAEVFSTPPLGEPGALTTADRELTIPAGTLDPGIAYSLNLEITRVASTNSTSYPEVTGFSATFSSTSVVFYTIRPPLILTPSLPRNGELTLLLRTDPDRTLVLQSSDSFSDWHDLATNSSPSGTNTFKIQLGQKPRQFYRARFAD